MKLTPPQKQKIVNTLWIIWTLSTLAALAAFIYNLTPLAQALTIGSASFFLGAEIVGAVTGYTYSEFVGLHITHPLLRWSLGVVQSVLAAVLIHPLLGIILLAVLPSHFLFMNKNYKGR